MLVHVVSPPTHLHVGYNLLQYPHFIHTLSFLIFYDILMRHLFNIAIIEMSQVGLCHQKIKGPTGEQYKSSVLAWEGCHHCDLSGRYFIYC